MKSTLKVLGILLIFLLGMATTFQSGNGKYFEITKNIEIFANLYKELNTYYVDDVDPGQLMRTGLDAMVGSLDPFTNYISESQIEGYRFMTEGKYNGIGAKSQKIGDLVTIVELYEDQAAAKAGLKVGDQIVAVDGKDATGKDEEAVNDILRGFPGTSVELTIRRPGRTGDFKVSLVREEVEVPSVPYFDLVSEDIGYLALTSFTREAGRDVAKAVRSLKEKNPELKGIIFDLRGNPGGLLNEAVNVSNVFIPKGELVVTTKGKVKEWDQSFGTLNSPVDVDIPLVVVIDKNSASASEIVSGVIQDYDRGVLLGQRSYGKGLVQNTKDIGYNAKLKMTIAKYYVPSGRCIQSVEYKNGEPVDIADDRRAVFKTTNGRPVLDGGGVKPDIVLELASDAPVIKSLIDDGYLFNYVTEFCLKNESIPAIEEFHFTDFDDFLRFLEEKGFNYESESEKLLKQLQATAAEEGYGIENTLQSIRSGIDEKQKNTLLQYKEALLDLIEKEIAGRYYFQSGKIKMGLRNDKEIVESINVLRDTERYKSILAGK